MTSVHDFKIIISASASHSLESFVCINYDQNKILQECVWQLSNPGYDIQQQGKAHRLCFVTALGNEIEKLSRITESPPIG